MFFVIGPLWFVILVTIFFIDPNFFSILSIVGLKILKILLSIIVIITVIIAIIAIIDYNNEPNLLNEFIAEEQAKNDSFCVIEKTERNAKYLKFTCFWYNTNDNQLLLEFHSGSWNGENFDVLDPTIEINGVEYEGKHRNYCRMVYDLPYSLGQTCKVKYNGNVVYEFIIDDTTNEHGLNLGKDIFIHDTNYQV